MTTLPMQPIRILVVDDHTLFRRGLTALLSQTTAFRSSATRPTRARRCAARSELQPDLILLDNHLPGVQRRRRVAGLQEAAPGARILMLTVSEDEQDLAAALHAGAGGYLLKTIEGDELVRGHPCKVLAASRWSARR